MSQIYEGIRIVGGTDWSDYTDIKMKLRFPEPQAVSVDPEKTILQIVDMQTSFVGADARKKFWRADKAIAQTQKLLDMARELDMVVVFQFSTSVTNPFQKSRRAPSANPTRGPIIDELKPIDRPNEYMVSKTTNDIFFHTHMDDILKTFSDIDTVIVTGVNGYVCPLYTVSGYQVRGYKVIVPMDAITSRFKDPRPQEKSLMAQEALPQALALQIMTIRSPSSPAIITLSNMITFKKSREN